MAFVVLENICTSCLSMHKGSSRLSVSRAARETTQCVTGASNSPVLSPKHPGRPLATKTFVVPLSFSVLVAQGNGSVQRASGGVAIRRNAWGGGDEERRKPALRCGRNGA